jgi:hypothetical protein
MVRRILDANPVREHGWRSAKGLQRLGQKYGDARVEAACAERQLDLPMDDDCIAPSMRLGDQA